jgi:hypothetical protein
MQAVTREEALDLYEGMVLGHSFEDMWKFTSSSVTLLLVLMRSGGLVMLPSYFYFYCFTVCFVQVVEMFASSSWLPVEIARKIFPMCWQCMLF